MQRTTVCCFVLYNETDNNNLTFSLLVSIPSIDYRVESNTMTHMWPVFLLIRKNKCQITEDERKHLFLSKLSRDSWIPLVNVSTKVTRCYLHCELPFSVFSIVCHIAKTVPIWQANSLTTIDHSRREVFYKHRLNDEFWSRIFTQMSQTNIFRNEIWFECKGFFQNLSNQYI